MDTIEVLTPDKINSLLNAVSEQKYNTFFRLAIFSGTRQGELFGLKWSDMDWENSQVHIQRTFNNQEGYDVKMETSNTVKHSSGIRVPQWPGTFMPI